MKRKLDDLGSSHGTTTGFAVDAFCDHRHGRPEQRVVNTLDEGVTVLPKVSIPREDTATGTSPGRKGAYAEEDDRAARRGN